MTHDEARRWVHGWAAHVLQVAWNSTPIPGRDGPDGKKIAGAIKRIVASHKAFGPRLGDPKQPRID